MQFWANMRPANIRKGDMHMTVFLQYLANGLSMGSIYAIIALGYTMERPFARY